MATYDVTMIDQYEYESFSGLFNSLVKIDATHFILAYRGSGADGFIETFSIDGDYDNIAKIDSLEHDTVKAGHNSLVMIDSTHFILAYAGTDDDGFIKTFSIDSSYDTITEIDVLEHDVSQGEYNSLVMIDSTHFVLAYSSAYGNSYIKTFSIDGSYDNITQIDSIVNDSSSGIANSLVKIDATHVILAYAGASGDGFIKTFSIDGSYAITLIDTLEHDLVSASHNSLLMIDSTHFILSYAGTVNTLNGIIKTFSIDSSYDNITQIDSLLHDTGVTYDNSLIMMDSTHFMLGYTSTAPGGFIKIFSIDSSYDTITQHELLTHDTVTSVGNSLVYIDATHTILAYGRGSANGYLKTFVYEAPAAGGGVRCRVFGGPFWGPLGGPI